MHLLFLTRLLVYAMAVAMPLVHPAVVVPYDRAGYLVWFALVPLEMLLAYALRYAATGTTAPAARGRAARLVAGVRRWLRPTRLLAAAGAAIVAAIAFGTGFDSAAWLVAAAGAGAFLLTLLIFGSREYGHTIAAAELFFIGYIYVKMLRFSRASEAISGASSLLTTVILLASIGGFLLHGIVIYQAAFPNRRPGAGRTEERLRGRREVTLFAAVIIPLIVVLAIILPPDFVEHQITFNDLNELPPSPPVPVDDFSTAPPGGNLRGQQQFEPQERPGGGQGNQQNQQEAEGARATPGRCRVWWESRLASGISAGSSNRSRSPGQRPKRAAAVPAAPRASRDRRGDRAASPTTPTRARRARRATATRTAATARARTGSTQ